MLSRTCTWHLTWVCLKATCINQRHLILTVLVLKCPCFNNHTISAGNFFHIHLSTMGIRESLSAVSIHKFDVNLQVAIRGVNLEVAIRDHKSLSAVSASRYLLCQSRGARCRSCYRRYVTGSVLLGHRRLRILTVFSHHTSYDDINCNRT